MNLNAAFSKMQPYERVSMMELHSFDETIKGIDRLAGIQQRHSHVIQKFVFVSTSDGQQRSV